MRLSYHFLRVIHTLLINSDLKIEKNLLVIQNLTKRFGGFTAVNSISFELGKGEILGLIGPNGSGKSTTFSLIAGLYAPSSGAIRLDGREIAGLPSNAICKLGVGRTFQIPRPFRKLSVLENASLAAFYGSSSHISREEANKRAAEALRLVGMPSDPGLQVEGLSVAGLKKLELARALATRPKILLADESLGGLDESEMRQAALMLRRIRDERELSIIWVEHIMGVLMGVVDRCLVLNHGEIIAEGTPNEVTNDPHVVEVYLGTEANDLQQQTQDRHSAKQSVMTDVSP